MNILHMKYAVEVAKFGSINKAAEALYIAQPNLSRCIKELEADMGIMIFDRSSKGMLLTPDGEDFLAHAAKVLAQIDEIEKKYKEGKQTKRRFSISVPRASYIAEAFAEFTLGMSGEPSEYYYMETNPLTAINNILNAGYNLGIIRYASGFDRYYMDMLEEKGLAHEVVAEFVYQAVMSRECPLAEKPEVTYEELQRLIEIVHGDPYVPSLPLSTVKKEELDEKIERRIFVFERGSQFDILTSNPETFMWVSPIPKRLLQGCHLVQRRCVSNTRVYRDVLIRRKDYVLPDLDRQFVQELEASKRLCL